jgi:hypothetical protein
MLIFSPQEGRDARRERRKLARQQKLRQRA